MLSHVFSHDGATYIVSFRQVDGQWLAALYRRGDDFVRPLRRFTEEEVGQFSDEAIRAGYVAVAKWVANGGMWAGETACEACDLEPVSSLIAASENASYRVCMCVSAHAQAPLRGTLLMEQSRSGGQADVSSYQQGVSVRSAGVSQREPPIPVGEHECGSDRPYKCGFDYRDVIHDLSPRRPQ